MADRLKHSLLAPVLLLLIAGTCLAPALAHAQGAPPVPARELERDLAKKLANPIPHRRASLRRS